MGKKYLGFGIRKVIKEKGLFKRKVEEENFCNIRVGADNFAEAQQTLCDNMVKHNIVVGFIFPYYKREGENEILADL